MGTRRHCTASSFPVRGSWARMKRRASPTAGVTLGEPSTAEKWKKRRLFLEGRMETADVR